MASGLMFRLRIHIRGKTCVAAVRTRTRAVEMLLMLRVVHYCMQYDPERTLAS